MSKTPSTSWDFRLYASVAGVLLCAIAFAALLTRPSWSNTTQTPKRFLGLDEPAEATRPAR